MEPQWRGSARCELSRRRVKTCLPDSHRWTTIRRVKVDIDMRTYSNLSSLGQFQRQIDPNYMSTIFIRAASRRQGPEPTSSLSSSKTTLLNFNSFYSFNLFILLNLSQFLNSLYLPTSHWRCRSVPWCASRPFPPFMPHGTPRDVRHHYHAPDDLQNEMLSCT